MELKIRMAVPNRGRGPGHVAMLEQWNDPGADMAMEVVARGQGPTPEAARAALLAVDERAARAA